MEYARKNTIKVRFGDQARSPTDGEMVTFIARNLGIKPEQVSHLYHDPYEKCIVIKFANEPLMKMCLEQHVGEESFGYAGGQYTKVMITDGNEEIKYVRLFYLPPEVPDREVAEFLNKFGLVKKIIHEKRPMASGFRCFSGTRGIYMDVTKEIPPQVYICNYRCRIYYSGMQEKCFICKATDHLKPDCPRRTGQEGNRNLSPRERVREKEEGIKLQFTNLNSLLKENQEERAVKQVDTEQCSNVLQTTKVNAEDVKRNEIHSDDGGLGGETKGAISNCDGGWVNVPKSTRHMSSVSSSSSVTGTQNGLQMEATTSKGADISVSNAYADLPVDADGQEISKMDPKKRKLSSKLSNTDE